MRKELRTAISCIMHLEHFESHSTTTISHVVCLPYSLLYERPSVSMGTQFSKLEMHVLNFVIAFEMSVPRRITFGCETKCIAC